MCSAILLTYISIMVANPKFVPGPPISMRVPGYFCQAYLEMLLGLHASFMHSASDIEQSLVST